MSRDICVRKICHAKNEFHDLTNILPIYSYCQKIFLLVLDPCTVEPAMSSHSDPCTVEAAMSSHSDPCTVEPAMSSHSDPCTVEPAMSSHSFEQPTSYGRPLGHSPK